MGLHLFRRAAGRGVGTTLCLLAALASAHPGLTGSTPKAGAVLDAPPSEIRLQFNEPVEAAFTTIHDQDLRIRKVSVGYIHDLRRPGP